MWLDHVKGSYRSGPLLFDVTQSVWLKVKWVFANFVLCLLTAGNERVQEVLSILLTFICRTSENRWVIAGWFACNIADLDLADSTSWRQKFFSLFDTLLPCCQLSFAFFFLGSLLAPWSYVFNGSRTLCFKLLQSHHLLTRLSYFRREEVLGDIRLLTTVLHLEVIRRD